MTSATSGSLTYTYLSDGTKVSAIKSDGSGKRYVGSMVYSVPESDGGSETLESAAWDEGRIFFDVEVPVDSTGNGLVVVDSIPGVGCYRDCWYVTDHLGNVRSIVDISASLAAPQVVERNDYLPYGTRLGVGNAVLESNRYRLGGKEEQTFGSLDLGKVDFGARMYDPFTAGWTTIDPMAAYNSIISPYAYCFPNPIIVFDPNGLDGYVSSRGEYKWFDDMTSMSFSDKNKTEWKRVTSERDKWDEAISIRQANIEALTDLGFDRDQVTKDVRLYNGDSPLFTKESHLMNPERYVANWESDINSATGKADALVSGEIIDTGLQLKFYSVKGDSDNANSLGLVRLGVYHLVEAGLEFLERGLFPIKADDDPLYDMHLRNAQLYLNRKKK